MGPCSTVETTNTTADAPRRTTSLPAARRRGRIFRHPTAYVSGAPQSGDPLGQNVHFTARWHDVETGLYYYRNRYYNAEVGGFTQRDPVYVVSAGLYEYAGSSPSNFIDPLGLEPERPKTPAPGFTGSGVGQGAKGFRFEGNLSPKGLGKPRNSAEAHWMHVELKLDITGKKSMNGNWELIVSRATDHYDKMLMQYSLVFPLLDWVPETSGFCAIHIVASLSLQEGTLEYSADGRKWGPIPASPDGKTRLRLYKSEFNPLKAHALIDSTKFKFTPKGHKTTWKLDATWDFCKDLPGVPNRPLGRFPPEPTGGKVDFENTTPIPEGETSVGGDAPPRDGR